MIEALREFTPEPVRDEEDLEKQLYQYLRAKGFDVERQPRLGRGLKADLRVENCIIELKIAWNRKTLQGLLGQVDDYKNHATCIITYILGPGKYPISYYENTKKL